MEYIWASIMIDAVVWPILEKKNSTPENLRSGRRVEVGDLALIVEKVAVALAFEQRF